MDLQNSFFDFYNPQEFREATKQRHLASLHASSELLENDNSFELYEACSNLPPSHGLEWNSDSNCKISKIVSPEDNAKACLMLLTSPEYLRQMQQIEEDYQGKLQAATVFDLFSFQAERQKKEFKSLLM